MVLIFKGMAMLFVSVFGGAENLIFSFGFFLLEFWLQKYSPFQALAREQYQVIVLATF